MLSKSEIHRLLKITKPYYFLRSDNSELIIFLPKNSELSAELIDKIKTWFQRPNHKPIAIYVIRQNNLVCIKPSYQDNKISFHEEIEVIENNSATMQVFHNTLSVIPVVHSPLFYAEQGLSILTMRYFQPQKASIQTVMRLFSLAYLLYARDASEMAPLIFAGGLQIAGAKLSQSARNNTIKIVLFYTYQLMLFGGQLAYHLYHAMPDAENERTLIAPWYVFQWLEQMSQKALLFALRFPAMIFCLWMLTVRADKKTLENPFQQSGFMAIAVLIVDFLFYFTQHFLFRYHQWREPQQAEQAILQFVKNGMRFARDSFHIQPSLFNRVLQLAFLNTQQRSVETPFSRCDVSIERDNVCYNTELSCQLFTASNPNKTDSLGFVKAGALKSNFSYCPT